MRLTNYTQILTINNGNKLTRLSSKISNFAVLVLGNYDFLECGTITGGPCDGDELWGTGTWMADDQEGCAGRGFKGVTALERIVVVRGKCASRCSLGWSLKTWTPGVNNWGAVNAYA